ncbi:pyrimidine dimer DNA glycosylase/endonuclease V [Gaoshiqia sp. Z1-71]|uniref:pyrimidine dimer DNA glycosylase/endonuclease V n=1 Tax=Gaoshiqia hydrogeniformans TaxID=3290090 RepID=UPI003BF7EF76
MRIWSVHPVYLDQKGLVALWREALLAKQVLEGKTKGYQHHPQLKRFKAAVNPLDCINQYLAVVWDEATKRGYRFDEQKINRNYKSEKLSVTTGQLNYETWHLLQKLQIRDIAKHNELIGHKEFLTHPLFELVDGEIEDWEKISE